MMFSNDMAMAYGPATAPWRVSALRMRHAQQQQQQQQLCCKQLQRRDDARQAARNNEAKAVVGVTCAATFFAQRRRSKNCMAMDGAWTQDTLVTRHKTHTPQRRFVLVAQSVKIRTKM